MSHQHAREIASRGFRVFEIRPDTKRPALKGWQDRAAKRDLSWWHADSAVGIATGEYEPGRHLLVLDVDDKPDKGRDGYASLAKLEAEHGPLPKTLAVETKSGGMHIYLWSPVPIANSVNKIGPGLDIRCAGGLVVAPGQLGYEALSEDFEAWQIPWAPDWLLGLCQKAREKSEKAGQLLFEEEPHGAIRRATRLLMEAEPACEGAGGDDWTYRLANKVLDEGVTPSTAVALMLEHWNDRCQPPWSYEDIETKVENAARYRKEAIGSRAVEADFDPVEVDDLTDGVVSEEEDEDELWPVLQATKAEVDFTKPEQVRGLIDHESIVAFYGPSNAGKSFIAIDLLSAVAKGEPWAGRETRQGMCLYFAMEGGSGIAKRLVAYGREKGGADGLYVIRGLAAVTGPKARDVSRIIKVYRKLLAETGMPPGMIAIDTVAKALGGNDEDKAEFMSAFTAALERIKSETGATVVIVHHPGKDESKGMRGSSALLAATESTFKVSKGVVVAEKERDHGKPPPFSYTLRKVVLGTNVYGDEVSSCVVDFGGTVEEEFGQPAGDEKDGDAMFRRAAQRALDASKDKSKLNAKMIFYYLNLEARETGTRTIVRRTFQRMCPEKLLLIVNGCPSEFVNVSEGTQEKQWVNQGSCPSVRV